MEDDLSYPSTSTASRNNVITQDFPTQSTKRFIFTNTPPAIVTIKSKEDFLKYKPADLKANGVLVQHRNYKKAKTLPLRHGRQLNVKVPKLHLIPQTLKDLTNEL